MGVVQQNARQSWCYDTNVVVGPLSRFVILRLTQFPALHPPPVLSIAADGHLTCRVTRNAAATFLLRAALAFAASRFPNIPRTVLWIRTEACVSLSRRVRWRVAIVRSRAPRHTRLFDFRREMEYAVTLEETTREASSSISAVSRQR